VQVLPTPPGEWFVTDDPGECIVTLTKIYRDEKIMVEMNINAQVGHSTLPPEPPPSPLDNSALMEMNIRNEH
jgi:hypothetical protein